MNGRDWRRAIAGTLMLLGACTDSHVPTFPEEQVSEYAAPAFYAEWWRMVESCSGRRADLDRVRWFRARRGHLSLETGSYSGYWWSRGNRIALHDPADGTAVRHEMLHAMLQDGGHPPAYFAERCGPLLQFLRVDSLPASGVPNLTTASAILDVDVELLTRSPSFAENGGHLTIRVSATNRTATSRWVVVQAYPLVSAWAEPGGYGAVSGRTDVLLFHAHERRSVVIDVEVQRPGTYRMRGTFAGVPTIVREIVVTP